MKVGVPPFIGEQLFTPLPGAPSRGVGFSEWETYRSDVAGKNIMLTTDDSNLSVNRDGKINGNTGDTDASGLNVTDATDSFIRGSESADEAPYQTAAAAIVDLASEEPGGGLDSDPDDDPDDAPSPEDAPETRPLADDSHRPPGLRARKTTRTTRTPSAPPTTTPVFAPAATIADGPASSESAESRVRGHRRHRGSGRGRGRGGCDTAGCGGRVQRGGHLVP